MKLVVAGATGMVGKVMLRVLEERNFPVTELIPVASGKSVGSFISFKGKKIQIRNMESALESTPDMALFSTGASVSKQWAPLFAEKGCTVIDNSSAWRMHDDIPLIVPEINADVLRKDDRIIANPNCSTIQMVMALAPLHRHYGIRRIVVSTYQSVTGTGKDAVRQMEDEEAGREGKKVYPHPIYRNALPHCDVFTENGYTKEEMKLINETRKILRSPSLPVTATAVRIPVVGGHSESINVSFEREIEIDRVRRLLDDTPGVRVLDRPEENLYPTPQLSHHKDEVFVGRIRRDHTYPNSLNMWVTADNLRKGAATNAIQIAEYVLNRFS